MGALTALSGRINAPTAVPPLPQTAADMPIMWRAARREDAAALHRLITAAERQDNPTERTSLEAVALDLRREGVDLMRDTTLAFDADGDVIASGTARLTPSPVPTATGTAVEVALEGVVHPRLRRRGIGTQLLRWQQARGLQLLATSPLSLPGMLTVGARAVNRGHIALYCSEGFTPVRWWLKLQRSLEVPIPLRLAPARVRIGRLKRGLSEPTRVALNEAFAAHWGFAPLSQDEWRSAGHLPESAPQLSRVAVAGSGRRSDPRRVVGFVLAETAHSADRTRVGHLAAIGVVPAWRGTGLATTLITDTLRAFRRAGLEHAVLDVDAENASGAVDLYAHLGFREADRAVSHARTF